MRYYDYQFQQWREQRAGEREIARVGSDGAVYYVDAVLARQLELRREYWLGQWRARLAGGANREG